MDNFESLSVILPVMNETYSLSKTIDTILSACDKDIHQFIIVVCSKTSPESMNICSKYKGKLQDRLYIHHQKLPFLGGAMREAFELVQGSHVIMMASDLETNPNDVKDFIVKAKENPRAIITASRWHKAGKMEGYNPVKFIANWIFQKFFSFIYKTNLTDLTYGFRLFPTSLVKSIIWEELKHPFLFETILKPLKLGVPVIEIPSVWRSRKEGISQNSFFKSFAYFRTGFKMAFYKRQQILSKNIFLKTKDNK